MELAAFGLVVTVLVMLAIAGLILAYERRRAREIRRDPQRQPPRDDPGHDTTHDS